MYSLSMKKELRAEHLLPFADGLEEERHEHGYTVEVKLKGEELTDEGYLVDLTVLEDILDDVIGEYQGEFLNDLDGFEGRNPTVENLSRAIWEDIAPSLESENVDSMGVRVWEDENSSGSYQGDV